MLQMFIATCRCPKGIFGLGGEASTNKLKDTSFIFSMTKVTILIVFRTNAQKEYDKVWEMKRIPITRILAISLFQNQQCIYQKSGLNGT